MSIEQPSTQSTFDHQYWLSIPDAISKIHQLRKTASQILARKLILGALIKGRHSGLEAIAHEFDETFVRLDSEHSSVYRGQPSYKSLVDSNFWRIGMAWAQDADAFFQTGDFFWEEELHMSELPYHLRDRSVELNNSRVRLTRKARGVHVTKEVLLAIAADRAWQRWTELGGLIEDPKEVGKPKRWKWNQVAAEIAIAASTEPELLRNGPGPIIQFINDEMRRLHYDEVPEPSDVSRFAQYFSRLWSKEEQGPPP